MVIALLLGTVGVIGLGIFMGLVSMWENDREGWLQHLYRSKVVRIDRYATGPAQGANVRLLGESLPEGAEKRRRSTFW
jgi:hypothetical protein